MEDIHVNINHTQNSAMNHCNYTQNLNNNQYGYNSNHEQHIHNLHNAHNVVQAHTNARTAVNHGIMNQIVFTTIIATPNNTHLNPQSIRPILIPTSQHFASIHPSPNQTAIHPRITPDPTHVSNYPNQQSQHARNVPNQSCISNLQSNQFNFNHSHSNPNTHHHNTNVKPTNNELSHQGHNR